MKSANSIEPLVLARADHTISRNNVDKNALKVLYRLHRSGHKAYLVGGAVRDLLLGRQPKDYDVATDARPPRIRRLFRNSRIIGRRFRLAHVFFREGIIEVSTFRRDPDPEAQRGGPGELLITDDNVFGSPREDAFRRDFTVNALFYNIADYSVIDYVGGTEDLKSKAIRAIGDATLRFREDPVRMTRACELAGRLGFTIERCTQAGVVEQKREILKASSARLTEEMLQILRCGRAGSCLQWMLDLGLLEVFMPEAMDMLTAEQEGLGRFGEVLPTLDRKVEEGRELGEIGLLASVLLPAVLLRRRRAAAKRGGAVRGEALRALVADAIGPFFSRFTLSKMKAEQVVTTMLALDRMRRGRWRTADRARFRQKPYFEDALLLYEIVARATGENGDELAAWLEIAARHPRPQGARRRPPAGRRRRRRPRRRPRRARP